MKKSTKTILICAAAVLAVLIIGPYVLGLVARNKIQSALTGIPGARIEVNSVQLSLLRGNLTLNDVEFAMEDSTGAGPQVNGKVGSIQLKSIKIRSLMKGEACAKSLIIHKPEAQVVLAKKTAKKKTETKKEQADSASFLKNLSLGELRVEKASIGLSQQDSPLMASVKGLGFSLQDIGMAFPENSVEFNDSTYSLQLDSLDFTDETGLNRIILGHLSTANAGEVKALSAHIYTCVAQEQLAEKMGKVSVMWYDAKLDSLLVSSVNLPRMIKDQRVELDHVHVSAPEVVLLQDDRYPPKVPYATLQEGLNAMDIPLNINKIDGAIKSFTFIWETTHVNRGTFLMQDVRLAMKSVSNAKANVMDLDLKAKMKGKGKMDFTLNVKNDKPESTHGTLLIKDLEASQLDDFIRPLFGATAKADIHEIDCKYKGDKTKMTADFCMQYENLSVTAWNDENAPFQLVAKNSKFLSSLANTILPNSNPHSAGKDPKRVEVNYERDPMLPYPSYLIQALTKGMLATVLPGGSVKKAKDNSGKKEKKK